MCESESSRDVLSRMLRRGMEEKSQRRGSWSAVISIWSKEKRHCVLSGHLDCL
jgi:hypothetical protein